MVVVNSRFLMTIKHDEGPVENQLVKARVVALGNVLFTKTRPSVKILARLGCVFTCVLDDSRWVRGGTSCQPSAVANSNRSHTSMWPSTFRCDTSYFLSPPREVLELFAGVPGLPWNIENMTALVVPVVMGLYGIMKSGFDFINVLGDVLIITHWISLAAEPALRTYGQVARARS